MAAVDGPRDLGARIAELRRRRALTQQRLAKKAGIGTSYLARIEGGSRQPTLDVLYRLAGALEMVPGDLLSAPGIVSERSRRHVEEELVAAIRKLPPSDLESLLAIVRRFRSRR